MSERIGWTPPEYRRVERIDPIAKIIKPPNEEPETSEEKKPKKEGGKEKPPQKKPGDDLDVWA